MIVQYRVVGRFVRSYTPFKSFPGTTLRGAFGLALRRISCKDSSSECKSCSFYRDCVYARVFESSSFVKPSARIASKSGKEGVTNPYTIEVVKVFDDKIVFNVNLFGEALKWEPVIVMAVVGMGFEGLGFDVVNAERRKFVVERIDWFDPYTSDRGILFTADTGFIKRNSKGKLSNLLEVFDRRAREIAEARVRKILFYFRTPYMLVSNGKPVYTPGFQCLVMNLARRYSLLAEYHEAGRPFSVSKARALKNLSAKVRLVSWILSRTRAVVKASIKGVKKNLGRFAKGVLVYKLPEDFWNCEDSLTILKLMLLGEYLHVGKLATAGYGDYELFFS
ncbi:MAG: CRISPR system precrRNA processing endoribonuclease RAMP protein Cas6 [Thermoproteales archaeon]|nr:CRISPR system precrRNA processing endoribonuclease RAMP protein Cas6 [Thermoproteales archaeon]